MIAFLTGWIPFVGIILGLVAVVFGIVALVQRQSKAMGIIGLALGAIALLTSVIITIGVTTWVGTATPNGSAAGVASSAPQSTDDAASDEPSENPAQPETPDLSSFTAISNRNFALLAKDPDAHIGEKYVLYGVITQLDAATGTCVMRVSIAGTKKADSFEYEQNALATAGDGESDCPVFDPVRPGRRDRGVGDGSRQHELRHSDRREHHRADVRGVAGEASSRLVEGRLPPRGGRRFLALAHAR